MSIHQLDVKNVNLYGNLNKTVFMHQPMGFHDPTFPNYVWRLKKLLYELKQAPRAWYQTLCYYVCTIGFVNSLCDHSIFIMCRGSDIAFLIFMWIVLF